MNGKQFPWVLVEDGLSWSEGAVYTRGERDGLPLLSRGLAPRNRLATRRQLRTRGLCPGGADPAAVLVTRHHRSGKCNFSNLWLIEQAVPKRTATPAVRAALGKAMAARRACSECGEDTGRYMPREFRRCDACRYAAGDLDPWDELHEHIDPHPMVIDDPIGVEVPMPRTEGQASPHLREVAAA